MSKQENENIDLSFLNRIENDRVNVQGKNDVSEHGGNYRNDNHTAQQYVQQPIHQQQQRGYQQPIQEEPIRNNFDATDKITTMLEKENVIRLILEHWKTKPIDMGHNSALGQAADKDRIIKAIIDKWKV